jgi:hypothetical protein
MHFAISRKARFHTGVWLSERGSHVDPCRRRVEHMKLISTPGRQRHCRRCPMCGAPFQGVFTSNTLADLSDRCFLCTGCSANSQPRLVGNTEIARQRAYGTHRNRFPRCREKSTSLWPKPLRHCFARGGFLFSLFILFAVRPVRLGFYDHAFTCPHCSVEIFFTSACDCVLGATLPVV